MSPKTEAYEGGQVAVGHRRHKLYFSNELVTTPGHVGVEVMQVGVLEAQVEVPEVQVKVLSTVPGVQLEVLEVGKTYPETG